MIVTPYNLPPEMCMSKSYMFLSCLIPRPSNLKASIDVCLEPLIDDLRKLWVGILTYDVSRKQNFMMRACLMWTINDFLAYGMLFGWGTHGRLACPHCMDHSKSFMLNYGRKSCWFAHIVGSYLMTITLGEILKPFEKAKLKQIGHLLS